MTLFKAERFEECLQRAGLIQIETLKSPMSDRGRYVGVTQLR